MPTEEEIRHLAHAIWEREGCPDGNADEHWYRAQQFLRNREVAEAAGAPSLASLSRQSEYYFRFSFAVATIAIGTTFVFLTPPFIISGLSSVIIGSILSLLGLVLIVGAGAERDPDRSRTHRINWGLRVMLVGIGMIPAIALVNYCRPGTLPSVLQLVGLAAFALGMWVAVLSEERRAQ